MSNSNAASYVMDAGPRNTEELGHRARAVAAAIEVIAAKASGADATSLKVEFANLSTYADQIQAALKVK